MHSVLANPFYLPFRIGKNCVTDSFNASSLGVSCKYIFRSYFAFFISITYLNSLTDTVSPFRTPSLRDGISIIPSLFTRVEIKLDFPMIGSAYHSFSLKIDVRGQNQSVLELKGDSSSQSLLLNSFRLFSNL